jgi:hypothetical protein
MHYNLCIFLKKNISLIFFFYSHFYLLSLDGLGNNKINIFRNKIKYLSELLLKTVYKIKIYIFIS